ncbi:MAG TPA: GntR family transcriptional regulator [Thermoanaerobaculia bacterium]|jgi:GntR family transcriptional regulator|nr:GntR family transcriptional regulator [Thermoanaerobaculia bacterium]HQR67668.1 GntR family transcriptional regulator [Thermoanaerobaculia bacterium]
MQRTLHVDPADATPIWRQLEEGIRRLVASGALGPGRPLPSVRDLAAELRINPATVAKAYQRLTDAGVLKVRRGEGTFVADAPPALAKGERSRELAEGAVRFASLAITLGAGRQEALDEVRDAFGRFARRTGGEP